MRTFVFGVAAAAAVLAATAAPSFAQRIDVGPGGVSVGVGPHRDWDRDRDARFFRRHHEFYGRGDCRDVTVQKRLPDGSTVTRRSRNCD